MPREWYAKTYRSALQSVHFPDRHLENLAHVINHLFKRLGSLTVQQYGMPDMGLPILQHRDFLWHSGSIELIIVPVFGRPRLPPGGGLWLIIPMSVQISIEQDAGAGAPSVPRGPFGHPCNIHAPCLVPMRRAHVIPRILQVVQGIDVRPAMGGVDAADAKGKLRHFLGELIL